MKCSDLEDLTFVVEGFFDWWMLLLKLEHKWSNYLEDVCHLGVSKNRGTPKLSILIGFGTIIFTIHLGVKSPYFWFNTQFEGFSLGILKKTGYRL